MWKMMAMRTEELGVVAHASGRTGAWRIVAVAVAVAAGSSWDGSCCAGGHTAGTDVHEHCSGGGRLEMLPVQLAKSAQLLLLLLLLLVLLFLLKEHAAGRATPTAQHGSAPAGAAAAAPGVDAAADAAAAAAGTRLDGASGAGRRDSEADVPAGPLMMMTQPKSWQMPPTALWAMTTRTTSARMWA